MLRLLLLSLTISIVAGCASQDIRYTAPYCTTDEVIVQTDDNTIDRSATIVQCTDDPGKQAYIQRAGIDKTCEEFVYSEMRWGKPVKQRGVRCQRNDGTWEILNINGFVR